MKLKRKITNKLLLVGIISILLTAVSASLAFGYFFTDQVKKDLKTFGQIAAEEYSKSIDHDFDSFAKNGVRVTVIDQNGYVILDNTKDVDKAQLENHNDRTEVIEARAKGSGEGYRVSETLGGTKYYYAQLLDTGEIVRVSRDVSSVHVIYSGIIPIIVLIIAYVFAVCIAFSSEATRTLISPIEDMVLNPENVTYEELIPFANIIEEQNRKIQKQIEKLQWEKEKISALMANMTEGFVLFDMNKNVLTSNESALRMLRANKVKNVNIINFSRNETLHKVVDKAILGENNYSDIKIGNMEIQISASPVYYDNKQNGVICILMDVTEKRKAENLRSEFTANVSHELKTPLTSISGYAEMIETGIAKPEDVKGFAHKICRESARLVTLIGDIIKLSRLEGPIEQSQLQKINLLSIARECAENLQLNAEKRQVKISAKGDDAFILGDRSLVYELVYNLCDNAIRYNKPDGTVVAEVFADENNAVVKVTDTGIGIPLEHQDRIFERFYRVDKSRSKETGGTGLGLAIVKYIVEQHNGEITLKSEQNKGTEITITFPKSE